MSTLPQLQAQIDAFKSTTWARCREFPTITVQEWSATLEAFCYRCVYCGRRWGERGERLAIDHWVPIKAGGKSEVGSLVPSCKSCNSAKGCRMPWNFCGALKYERILAILDQLSGGRATKNIEELLKEQAGERCRNNLKTFKNRRIQKMAITAEATSNNSYTPAPAGIHSAVCVDVVDRGLQTSTFEGEEKTAHKISIHWQIEAEMEDGRPFSVSKWFTLSMHDRSALRPFVEEWLGRPFLNDEEARRFDLETLIGQPATVSLVAYQKQDGSQGVKIKSAMPFNPRLGEPLQPRDYVRFVDRQAQDGADGYSGQMSAAQGNGAQNTATPATQQVLSAATKNKITALAVQIWGEVDAPRLLNDFKLNMGMGKWADMTEDHGAQLIDELRRQTIPHGPYPNDDEDDADPFGD